MAITSAPRQWTYDVFVSFRGEDIRKSFVDHLFKDFKLKGIHVFEDDIELPRGEEISPKLYKAIEESMFLIVIFSKNYASSSWCLRELTKILELKQMGDRQHESRIIFYDVKPDVVRKQTESYAEAFVKHVILNSTEVVEWKEALYEAANMSGQDLQDVTNGYESKFIDKISEDILKKLCCDPLHVGDNLVGVDALVTQMDLSRFIGSGKVHMIGISGISGIGKTTFARAIYNSMCTRFEECCFLEDVKGITKQKGLTQVQMLLIEKLMRTTVIKVLNVSEGIMVIKKRMASKRIMVVLDDVDDHEQFEALAGSSDWFSPGSFIIFTSQDKQLLKSQIVDEIYDMKFLPHHESLKLFSLYAFGKTHPVKEFEELAYQVVDYSQGHPLALKVLARCLYKKPKSVWKSELDRLKKYPHIKIQQKLQPSFDELDSDQKRIFLDIAFLLIGVNKDFAASILDNDTCSAYANMEVLVDKSLITISRHDNSLQMHDLLKSMARGIMHEEFEEKKVKKRLRNSTELFNILSKKATKAGAEAVEIFDLLLEKSNKKVLINVEAFEDMRNLRILKIRDGELGNVWLPFELNLLKNSKVNYSGRLKFLSNKLRLLCWHGCPFKSFPPDFYPEFIVAINLSYSHIKRFWTTPKCFERLKVMELENCRNLTSTPNFTMIKNLEELIFEGCVNLVNVHPSFGMLNKLVVLNMRNCKRFNGFPSTVKMGSLEVMDLSGCSSLKNIPDFFGTVPTLREVLLVGTAITELPSFESSQNNLEVLKIGQHERIQSRRWRTLITQQQPHCLVMPSLVGLCSLRKLVFCNSGIVEVPDSIGGLSCLESLDLCGNNFTSLPRCLSHLSRLETLKLSRCKKMEVLPKLPPNIYRLDVSHCTSLKELQGLPTRVRLAYSFDFSSCPKLLWNLTGESKVSILQPWHVNSFVTSRGSVNHFSFYLWYMDILSTICGIYLPHEISYRSDYIDIMLRGNGIPQWFTNQSKGNHVKVELPPDWCYDKFRGFGTCVVFKLKKPNVGPTLNMNNFDGVNFLCYPFFCKPMFDSRGMDESDFIWFHFSTQCSVWKEMNHFLDVSFGDDVEVKECGVRLVYDVDIQEETYEWITKYFPTTAQGMIYLAVDYHSMKMYW